MQPHRPYPRTPAAAAAAPCTPPRPHHRPPRPDAGEHCGWFASSADLRHGLLVVETVLTPAEFARWWSAPPAAGTPAA